MQRTRLWQLGIPTYYNLAAFWPTVRSKDNFGNCRYKSLYTSPCLCPWCWNNCSCMMSFFIASESIPAGQTSELSERQEADPVLQVDDYCQRGSLPVPYVLCRFPDDIQQLLDAGDPALARNSFYRRKLRKSISEDMAKYTLWVDLQTTVLTVSIRITDRIWNLLLWHMLLYLHGFLKYCMSRPL